jgi:hypothetical protein
MAKQDEIMVLENVGGVDENSPKLSRNPTTNFSNVENIHLLQCDNDLTDNDELHLAIQVHKWKPNNKNSIFWSLFPINDNFPIYLKNPQML